MAHWSQTAHSLKVLNTNAAAFIPLLLYVGQLSNFKLLLFAIFCVICFFILENFFKIKVEYLPSTIRFKILGKKRTARNTGFEI